MIYSNDGKLVLSSDLWQLTIGVNSKVNWKKKGKLFHLTIFKGSAILEKVSERKAYLQLNTPNSSSTGEIDNFFIHVSEMSTKIWMTKGELDFKLKSVSFQESVASGELLEYRSGDTAIHKIKVDENLLTELQDKVLEHDSDDIQNQTAVDEEKLALVAKIKAHRKENRFYNRTQRNQVIQSIQEAVLLDSGFIFSIPLSPPPR